jgi:hypothetical protein
MVGATRELAGGMEYHIKTARRALSRYLPRLRRNVYVYVYGLL